MPRTAAPHKPDRDAGSAQSLPHVRRLRDLSGETVNLGVTGEGEVVFLNQVESREMMRATTRPGGRAPMHCSGLGKAPLAALTEAEVSDPLRTRGLRRLTAKSIARPAQLREALAAVRRAGYAVDDEEPPSACAASPPRSTTSTRRRSRRSRSPARPRASRTGASRNAAASPAPPPRTCGCRRSPR
jgi:DNA-binding IclR family transcriptional regulator